MDKIPENLRYSREHEWVLAQTGSLVRVGITEFAQSQLGELVYVDLPELGKHVTAGEIVCVVESTKAASDVYTPLSGKITGVNETLSSDPALINREPYQGGWLFDLEISNTSEMSELMDAAAYADHTA
jgi:glycine cleavage system H protein